MNFFKNIFKKNNQFNKTSSSNKDEKVYMPEEEDPIEERFTYNFTKNGGKFLYCENRGECDDFFNKICSIEDD